MAAYVQGYEVCHSPDQVANVVTWHAVDLSYLESYPLHLEVLAGCLLLSRYNATNPGKHHLAGILRGPVAIPNAKLGKQRLLCGVGCLELIPGGTAAKCGTVHEAFLSAGSLGRGGCEQRPDGRAVPDFGNLRGERGL